MNKNPFFKYPRILAYKIAQGLYQFDFFKDEKFDPKPFDKETGNFYYLDNFSDLLLLILWHIIPWILQILAFVVLFFFIPKIVLFFILVFVFNKYSEEIKNIKNKFLKGFNTKID